MTVNLRYTDSSDRVTMTVSLNTVPLFFTPFRIDS
jgi:hypothetical protein